MWALANPPRRGGNWALLLNEHLCWDSSREDRVCDPAVTTGPNSHLLLTVFSLQFKNCTNSSESSPTLLWILCSAGAPEGGGPTPVADLFCVTGTTVHAKQIHWGVCTLAWPQSTSVHSLCSPAQQGELWSWCSFPPPLQMQPALFFQHCTLLKQERGEYPLQETPERIKWRERKLSRVSLWEFLMGAPATTGLEFTPQ